MMRRSAAVALGLALALHTAAAGDGVRDLTADNFDDVIDGSHHALVEFFAPVRGLQRCARAWHAARRRSPGPGPAPVPRAAPAALTRVPAPPRGTLRAVVRPLQGARARVRAPGRHLLRQVRARRRGPRHAYRAHAARVAAEHGSGAPSAGRGVAGHGRRTRPDVLRRSRRRPSRRSDDVIIAKVDADAHRDLAGRFEVRGYPTIKWFPKGSTKPEDYSGGRSAEDFVQFINDRTGAQQQRSAGTPTPPARLLTAAARSTLQARARSCSPSRRTWWC